MEQQSPIAHCRVCNNEFRQTRADKVSCSNTCNVRLYRLRKKAERVEGLNALDELKRIVTQLAIDVQKLKTAPTTPTGDTKND